MERTGEKRQITLYLLLAPVVCFFMALAAYLLHADGLANRCSELTFVVWLAVSVYLGLGKRDSLVRQDRKGMLVLSLILALFWDSTFLAPGEVTGGTVYRIIGTVCLNMAAAAWIAGVCADGRLLFGSRSVKRENALMALALAVIIILLSWETLDDWYRWDSYYYMTQIENANKANFTLSLLQELNLVNHLSSVYSILVLTVSRIAGSIPLGARLTNWFLAWWAGLCFYRILRKALPDKRAGYAVMCTLAFTCSPWLLGLIGEVSLDYAGFCALTALFWYLYDGQTILSALCAALLVFSKEPGVVVCAAMALYVWVRAIIEEIRAQRKALGFRKMIHAAWTAVWSGKVLALGIPVVLWLVQYLRLSHWGETDSSHYFGFNSGFLRQKIPTALTLNFNWIFLFVIAASAVLIRRRRKKQSKAARNRVIPENLMPMAAGTLAFLLFNIAFVTFNHARYNLLMIPGLYLTAFLCYGAIIRGSEHRIGALLPGALALTLLVQTFWQIDPVSKAVERSVDIGSTALISTNWNDATNNFGDSVVTNRQYTYFDDAFDLALEEIDYQEGMALVLPGCFNIFQGLEPEYIYYGMLGNYSMKDIDIYWDRINGRRSLESGELLRIYVMTEEFVSQDVPERLYYIAVPWYEEDTELLARYEKIDEHRVSYRGWEITIYELGDKKA